MTDRRTVYTVVVFIGLLAVGLYSAAVALLFAGVPVPGELWQAAGTATGALGGLLVSTRSAPPSDSGSGSTPAARSSLREQPDRPPLTSL